MIKSFANKVTEKIFNRERVKGFHPDVQRAALRRMVYLNQADSLNDLAAVPSNRLEALTAGRRGQYSIRINEQWRICFEWKNGDAFEVEIVDYH